MRYQKVTKFFQLCSFVMTQIIILVSSTSSAVYSMFVKSLARRLNPMDKEDSMHRRISVFGISTISKQGNGGSNQTQREVMIRKLKQQVQHKKIIIIPLSRQICMKRAQYTQSVTRLQKHGAR